MASVINGKMSKSLSEFGRDARYWFAEDAGRRQEMRVAREFEQPKIESFLPVERTQLQEKDGPSTTLGLPLFGGYAFVQMKSQDGEATQQGLGLFRLIRKLDSGTRALDGFQNEALRAWVDPLRTGRRPLLSIGRQVRIWCGSHAGIEGKTVSDNNNARVLLTLELRLLAILSRWSRSIWSYWNRCLKSKLPHKKYFSYGTSLPDLRYLGSQFDSSSLPLLCSGLMAY
jgi:hypothetical protein